MPEKSHLQHICSQATRTGEGVCHEYISGGLLINDTTLHLALSSLPSGGVGESGMGSYHGRFSFEAFSHKKAVLHRSFGGEVGARYPPYTPRKTRFVKALLNGNILGLIRALFGW
ncbi:hypothetical protein K7X08_004748 [Anisodus acutangulus]|uniref:Aldehyde dehydrogenase domain-containing protein n=1 Tax=Anisodus acutangulus TaxID=402998 RepID=A0A9Q1RI43_9SOLA|nr:hypothetical protein K7X08_004748 [Anisodus acutangulus]